MNLSICLLFAVLGAVTAEIYFKEDFDDGYESRWTHSTFKGTDQGKFTHAAGKFYNDPNDKGIQTSQDAKFYGISAKFDKPFSNEGKTLVIQFTVKHEQGIDCGGGYVKLLGSGVDPLTFQGETPYKIMFGPDICGMTKRVHVIFHYKGQNLLHKKEVRCKEDELTHLYTLIVKPDNTYEVLIDNEKAESGELEKDWDFLKPKKIPDPNAKKPEDWVDNEKMDDPDDKKPDDWDKPKTIADPNAKKPDDWDDEMDGEWEAPQIDNPDYKGEWKPKQIDNPKYKGQWVHPEIDNPEYQPDANLYKYEDIGGIGFDLWQVKSGSIFDKILITDDPAEAKKQGDEYWKKTYDGEKAMKDKADEEEKKKMEEEEAKRKAEEEATKKKEEEEKKDEKKDEEEKPADPADEEIKTEGEKAEDKKEEGHTEL